MICPSCGEDPCGQHARCQLDRLEDALCDCILDMNPDEIRGEIIEDGEDPDAVAEKVKGIFRHAVNTQR